MTGTVTATTANVIEEI